jgi:hypothetical protein
MVCFEKRVFPLHHRPQTKLSQVAMNSLGGYRLVGHIFKSFGHLDCIICLAHSDQTLSIIDICSSELVRAAPRRLWKLGTVLSVNLGDSTSTSTS